MLTRREALTAACGAAALTLGPALLADDAVAADGIKRKANGQVVVTVAKVPALRKVGGSVNLGTVNGVPVALVRTGSRTYRALDLRCPHQGTTVGRDGAAWRCPAHGSRFGGDGTLTGGPARRSLGTVRSTVADGKVTVG